MSHDDSCFPEAGSTNPSEFTRQTIAELRAEVERLKAPVPLIMHCPECGARHIDEGEFATKPHKTHSCQHCGTNWRPALVPTFGVRFLPGCKNDG